MITVEGIIARVTALRQESMEASVRAPDRDRPEFAYGVACGRDDGFAMVLEMIGELIEVDANRDKREED